MAQVIITRLLNMAFVSFVMEEVDNKPYTEEELSAILESDKSSTISRSLKDKEERSCANLFLMLINFLQQSIKGYCIVEILMEGIAKSKHGWMPCFD